MDPWRAGDMAAIVILSRCITLIDAEHNLHDQIQGWGYTWLAHAIRHLAYPDRDLYPKVRHGSKKHPVMR